MSNGPSNRDRWEFYRLGQVCDHLLESKPDLIDMNIALMLSRTQEIFVWEGLPETIPQMDLELLIQRNGYAIITDVPGKGLYAFYGGLGGQRNAYYRPTIATVANPYLNFSDNLEIGKECEIILNDPFYMGLSPLFSVYAEQLAETDISLRFAEINSRIEAFLVADTETAKNDAERVLSDIVAGSKLGVIGDQSLFDGIKSIAYSGRPAGNLKDLMELRQYFKSQWFIDMGLNANFNMKREAINESEAEMGVDCLLPLISQMLKQRQEGAERINKLYGTSISVRLSDIWEKSVEDAEREDPAGEESSENKEDPAVQETEEEVSNNEEDN